MKYVQRAEPVPAFGKHAKSLAGISGLVALLVLGGSVPSAAMAQALEEDSRR